jgi:glutamyl-Q tRNA(Asp) synthetase
VILEPTGAKLAKRRRADPIASQNPAKALEVSLRILGQKPPTSRNLPELWEWALENWSIADVPRRRACDFSETGL